MSGMGPDTHLLTFQLHSTEDLEDWQAEDWKEAVTLNKALYKLFWNKYRLCADSSSFDSRSSQVGVRPTQIL